MSKLPQLLKIMKEDQANEEEIALVVEEMTKSGAVELYTHLVALLSAEDIKQLDAVADDQDQVDQLINQFYQKYEGKTTQEAMDEINDKFIDAFLENY
jgi:hypothetical protein